MNDFFANWYELLAYFDGFSDDMYNQNLYITIGLCMTLIPVGILTVYYYAINSVKFGKWWHWLLLVVALCAINFGISYVTSYNEFLYLYEQQNQSLPYTTEFVGFSLINALWVFVVSFVWSMIIKWGSKQCRRTPF
jgi:magnesium-transporting ATPase (P-type)